MSKFDVVALGELLVDFSKRGMSASGNPMLEANPGGAPCNVLAMLHKLGKHTAFIGKVGADFLGDFLADEVKEQGIDISCLSKDEKVPTTLAFVDNAPDGERSFSFYRNPGADMMLRKKDVDLSVLDNTTIFHFGTISMTDTQIEETTKYAVNYVRQKGKLVSFDPNLRPLLWDDMEHAKEMMIYGMSVCDILKISDNEIAFVTGTENVEEGIQMIKDKYSPTLICATMGKGGSIAVYDDLWVKEAAFLQKDSVDTTGAGDTFMACVLNYVLEQGLGNLNEMGLRQMLLFANGAASIVTTRTGALKVMPERQEVKDFLISNKIGDVRELKLTLDTIDKVKKFVATVTEFDAEFSIKNDRYIVDAKSIMGIFSLDLSKPLTLSVEAPDEMMDKIVNVLKEYTV